MYRHNKAIVFYIKLQPRTKVLQVKYFKDFFDYTKRRVFLSVRSDNLVAKKFYEKNGMKIVGHTSWTKDGVKNALPGDVYMYDNVQDIL